MIYLLRRKTLMHGLQPVVQVGESGTSQSPTSDVWLADAANSDRVKTTISQQGTSSRYAIDFLSRVCSNRISLVVFPRRGRCLW